MENTSSFYTPTKLKAPFGWVGGKSKLAKDIVTLMPPHRRYIEVFAGGLSVLYAKPSLRDILEQRKQERQKRLVNKQSNVTYSFNDIILSINERIDKYSEIINDINGDLINLHTIIKTRPQSLRQELSTMLYSREIFENIKKGKIQARNAIQRAAFYYYMLSYSFSSRGVSFAMAKNRHAKNLYKDFSVFSKRLRNVCIENMDFGKLIQEYDYEHALFYLDPPYVRSSRKSGKLYRHEMDDDQQRQMLDLITRSRAKIVLSGYQSELYDNALQGWYKDITQSRTTSTELATEVLWTNYRPSRQISFFDRRPT